MKTLVPGYQRQRQVHAGADVGCTAKCAGAASGCRAFSAGMEGTPLGTGEGDGHLFSGRKSILGHGRQLYQDLYGTPSGGGRSDFGAVFWPVHLFISGGAPMAAKPGPGALLRCAGLRRKAESWNLSAGCFGGVAAMPIVPSWPRSPRLTRISLCCCAASASWKHGGKRRKQMGYKLADLTQQPEQASLKTTSATETI